MQHDGDRDVQLWIGRLPPETVRKVLGPQAERLARNATILEARISAGASPVPMSRDSFRLRLPSGEGESPLETKWVLAAMSLPRNGARARPSAPESWPAEGAIDIKTPEEAILYLALLAPFVVVQAVSQAVKESHADHANQASVDVRATTKLPRVVAPGKSVELLLVYWPKTGRIPKEGFVPLEVRFELERCTWQRELEIPMNVPPTASVGEAAPVAATPTSRPPSVIPTDIGTLTKAAVMVPSNPATLFVSCSTPSALWVDGKRFESCSPGHEVTVSLTPGKHAVRAESSDTARSNWLEIVDVGADTFTTLRLDKGGKTAIKVDKR